MNIKFFFVFADISLLVSFLEPITKKHLLFVDFCELEIEQLNLFNLNTEQK